MLTSLEIYAKFKVRQGSKEQLFYLLVPISLYFSSTLGTNNNLFEASSYNVLLLYPLVYSLRLSPKNFQVLSVLIFVFAFTGIYNNQYSQTYRSLPRHEQTFVASQFPLLSGIKINQKTELKLVKLEEMLASEGFDRKSDQVMVYPNMPGLISYLNLKAFGNPWNMDIYPNSFIYNCIFYKIEPKSTQGRLYLYAEKELSPQMTECLNRPFIKLKFISK